MCTSPDILWTLIRVIVTVPTAVIEKGARVGERAPDPDRFRGWWGGVVPGAAAGPAGQEMPQSAV